LSACERIAAALGEPRPLIAIGAVLAIGAGGRALLHRLRYGSSGVRLFRTRERAQLARDAGLVFVFGALIAQDAWAAVDARALSRQLLPLAARAPDAGPIGEILVALGLAVLVAAQLQLGASWRVGIEEGARPGLVTHGLYRWSRNPIFVGLWLAIAGHALLAPTWLSLVAFLALTFGIRAQVRAEERWLETTYGDAFRDWAARTGRFVPGVGRMRGVT
jgi:protein-S-isoprenylcysteine O-methyltransferase Ste14